MARTLIVILTVAVSSFAGILGDETVRPAILEAIECRFDHRFARADSIIDSLAAEFPHDPAPLFLRGSNLYDEMMHREDYSEVSRMNAILDSAIFSARTNTVDPWNLWIVGSALGYKAMAKIKLGKYLAGYGTSRDALGYLKLALDSPETRADAALGAGGYYYWASATIGFLRYLPLVSDNRDEGLDLLREAYDGSHFSRYAAGHAMVYIFINRNELDSARVYRDTIAERFPESLLPLWYNLAIAEAEKSLENYYTAAHALAFALDTLGDEQIVNFVEVHHFAAMSAKDLTLWDKAIYHCDKVLNAIEDDELSRRFRSQAKDCEAIRKTAIERMGE
ncbi:MAG TPA: hypothetical protein ENN07_06505 [candidate division Zixibacteria bacterium]|nr:hypothetical protein [candidate division Zixibacteria bacterium]